jgi:hypothetical protein
MMALSRSSDARTLSEATGTQIGIKEREKGSEATERQGMMQE